MSEWFNSITHAISKIIVKSVVDSLGKSMLFALLFFVVAAVLIVLISFPGILLILYVISYSYCLIKNPDLLRLEEYNIKKQVVEVLAILVKCSVSINR